MTEDQLFKNTRLRTMTTYDLPAVMKWRNHENIRLMMFSPKIITAEEHKNWYEKVSTNDRRHLFIFENNGRASGFVQLTVDKPSQNAEWGFYTDPEAPKGTGKRMAEMVLEHCFNVLALHKINAQVLSFNHRSLRYHQQHAFLQEGTLREQHFDGQNYHDIACFGLLKKDWLSLKGIQ